jgi:two-component system, NarL family, nitrate/nitrite response regulator NarL
VWVGGGDLADEIAAASPRTKVMILSADGDGDTIMRAMRAGAAGYVHKPAASRSCGRRLSEYRAAR